MAEHGIQATPQATTAAPSGEARLQRMPDGRLGGVCAGIGMRFGLDAEMVRLVGLVLAVLTGGLVALAYLVAWCVLPIAGGGSRQVDARATSISSENYGAVAGSVPSAPLSRTSRLGVALALVAGIAVLVAGMAVTLSHATQAFEPVQFWPLLLVAAGIARMVIPDAHGRHGMAAVAGAMVFFVGAMLLLATLGLARLNIEAWFVQGAPLLLASAGFALVGRGAESPVLALCGAAAFALFCVVGMMFYLEPGSVHQVVALLPDGREVSLLVVG